MTDLLSAASHFEFGKNWKSFVDLVDERRIALSVEGLRDLVGARIQGASFLDIGCGSGLSALAAARLGAARVTAVDIDENSVGAAHALLTKWLPDFPWTARARSIFDMSAEADGTFDVVYSWGVLHHTGDMWAAIARAASLVAPDGILALALYRKTRADGFWKVEKRVYSSAARPVQTLARFAYKTLYLTSQLLRGKNPLKIVKNYETRGMDWSHDVHDWLGGFPYETVAVGEVEERLSALGFSVEREHVYSSSLTLGLFGSGCDEWVLGRPPPA